jgi:hypothetical protein
MDLVPQFLRRWTFWLVLAGLLLAYAGAGFFLVPWLLKSQAREYVTTTYQRELAIGDVRFNPFTLALDVRNVALPDRDGRPMLEFDRFFVNFQAISLFRRAWSFEEIILDRPGARLVVRPDGTINFAYLAGPQSAPAEPEPANAPPPRLYIERFAVTSGYADVEDASRPTPFTASLRPITFTLDRFSTTGSGDNAYELTAESQRGEKLAWSGTFGVSPLSSAGKFQLSNVQAHTVWEYLRDGVSYEIPTGMLDLAGRYEFSLARQPVLKVFGDSVKTSGIALRPKGTDTDWIALDALNIEGATIDVLAQRAEIGTIVVRGGTVRTWLDAGGQFNLPQLFTGPVARALATTEGRATAPAPAPTSGDTGAPSAPSIEPDAGPARPGEGEWVLSIPRIEVSELRVLTEDRSIEPAVAWELAPVNATIGGFTTAPGATLAIDAQVDIDGEGKLAARGTLEPETSVAALDLELEKLDLRPFQPYLDRYTHMTLTSGRLGFKGHLDLKSAADSEGVQPDFRGKVEVTALRTIDNALEQDFLRWERLTLNDLEYLGPRNRLTIREVAARRPYARVIIASDGSVNIATVLQKEGAAPAEESAVPVPGSGKTASAKPLLVRIGVVRLDRMSANFADYSLQPNFATGIQELNGTVTGLSSAAGSRAKVDLDGKVDAYAPVTIDGEVNYLSADAYTDLKLSFDNMELTTFTPYSGKFAGYRIEKGKLSVDLAYHVENRQLVADHNFVLDQLTLGERVESKDALSLPIKLAVALLKDRNGVIDVDLPITGSLDDPKFRIGPIIWKAVVGLLTKIVTAPFALLGSLFGGGEEVNQIVFAAGSSEPAPESAARIDSVGKALQERPALGLEIPLAVNRSLDQPALQKAQLRERLIAIKRRELLAKRRSVDELDASVLEDREEYFRLLRELDHQVRAAELGDPNLKREKQPDVPKEALETEIAKLESEVLPRIPVDDVLFADLGKARAEAVRQQLLGGGNLDPARVFITASGEATAENGSVRMDLSLR